MNSPIRFSLTSALLLLIVLVQIGFCVWSIDKGFDFTDEAYAFLGLKWPEEINKVATYYTFLFDAFFGWINVSIIHIRIFRLLALVFCSMIFSLGLTDWLKRRNLLESINSIDFSLFTLIGSFLVHATGSQSFTYNIASLFLLQLIVGILFFNFQRKDEIKGISKILYAVLGALLFSLFTTKFSGGIVMTIIVIMVQVFDQMTVKRSVSKLALALFGALSTGLAFFGTGLLRWFSDYKSTLSLLANLTTSSITSRYIEDLQYTLSSKIEANIIFTLLIILLLIAIHFNNKKWIRLASAAIVGILLVYVSYTRDFYLGGVSQYYIFTGLYILLIFILLGTEVLKSIYILIKGQKQKYAITITAIFVLLLPIIGAIGTNNLISIQIIWYSSFLFTAIYLLASLSGVYALNIILVVLGVNAGFQCISGLVYNPYRINGTLFEESYRLSPEVTDENVKVNAHIKESVELTHKTLHSKTVYKEGDPIFTFSPDYIGFIYLLNGVLPGWSWYDEIGTSYNCYNLTNSKVADLNKMIVFTPSYYEMDSTYSTCFRDLKLQYPTNYEKIGDITYFMGDLDRSFSIYAPLSMIK